MTGSTSEGERGAGASLQELPGIGRWTEARLVEAGVEDLGDLAQSSPNELHENTGNELPEEKLALWIEEAKRRLRMGPTGGASRNRLRSVKGVGPMTEIRLRGEGIHSLLDLLDYTPEELAEIAGRGKKTVNRLLRKAERMRRDRNGRREPIQTDLAEETWPGTAPPSPRHDPHEELWPQDEADWKADRDVEAACGLSVRSTPESWIADFLYDEGIYFVYEPIVCGYRPDFYIPGWGLIIEYWGWSSLKYRKRRRAKTEAYRSTGYRLINLENRDGMDKHTLRRKLRRRLLDESPN